MIDCIPNWIISCFRVALLGEIYPQIRAIAIRYDDDKNLLLRYYLDRESTDFDLESIEIVATNFDATAPVELFSKFDVECLFAEKTIRDLDSMTGFSYSRREYEIQENPSQSPTYINISSA